VVRIEKIAKYQPVCPPLLELFFVILLVEEELFERVPSEALFPT